MHSCQAVITLLPNLAPNKTVSKHMIGYQIEMNHLQADSKDQPHAHSIHNNVTVLKFTKMLIVVFV